eukprot:1480078-Ditylum_brightwellii.AAC.1
MADTYSTFLNKQVRKAFILQHSLAETDQLLFHMPLQDGLQYNHDAKAMWLEDSWAITITTDHHIIFSAGITSTTTPDY